jgi:hypothetical protein
VARNTLDRRPAVRVGRVAVAEDGEHEAGIATLEDRDLVPEVARLEPTAV